LGKWLIFIGRRHVLFADVCTTKRVDVS
jgi:hypothetical protein